MEGKAIVVAGVPGVGKTTVLEEASKKLGMRIVVFGTVMFEIAKERGLVDHRDEIRKLPSHVQREIQEEAASRIREMGEVIVDTHMLIKTPAGFLPGLPFSVLQKLSPGKIILIEADPEEIAKRRAKDKSRERDVESVEDIKMHQELNRVAAICYGILSGAFVGVVKNREGKISEAVDELVQLVRG